MNYRNRGKRCPHGVLKGYAPCPGCGQVKYKKKYVPTNHGKLMWEGRGQTKERANERR